MWEKPHSHPYPHSGGQRLLPPGPAQRNKRAMLYTAAGSPGSLASPTKRPRSRAGDTDAGDTWVHSAYCTMKNCVLGYVYMVCLIGYV